VNRTVASITRVSLLAGLAGALIIFILAPYLIPWIFGKEFTGSVRLIQMILPGILILILFRILNSRLAGMGKPQIAIYTFIPALVLNILLNYLWIPAYGAMGAVWATNISYAAGTILFLVIYLRMTRMSFIDLISFRKSDFYFIHNIKRRWRTKE